jgi:hypothetical protein
MTHEMKKSEAMHVYKNQKDLSSRREKVKEEKGNGRDKILSFAQN